MSGLRRHTIWLMPVLSALIMWGLWHGAAAWIEYAKMAQPGVEPDEAASVRRILLPLPGEILSAFWANRSLILHATGNTFLGALLGFLAAVGAGGAIALLLGLSRSIKRALYPWVLVLQMTPIIIMAPIFALWLGQGIASIVAITFTIGFFPVVANTTMGLISTDKNLLDLFAVCQATRRQELLYLRIPYAMPYFLTGVKIAGTLAPLGAITGDILVGNSASGRAGIGFLTIIFRGNLNVPALYATAGVACLLGFCFVGAVNVFHWWALRHWHDSVARKDQ